MAIEIIDDGNIGENLEPSRVWVGAPVKPGTEKPIFAEVNGILCEIEIKAVFLKAGIVACVPSNFEQQEDWPGYVRLRTDGNELAGNFLTRDPKLVAAAWRYINMTREGSAPVPVGTRLG